MIFKIKRRESKHARFGRFFKAHQKWNQFFAIWPRRISTSEVACLQWITRRVRPEQVEYKAFENGIIWEYGPLTNLLQPMENLNEKTITGVDLGSGDSLTLQTISVVRDGTVQLSAAARAAQVNAIRKQYEAPGLGGYFHTPKD